MADLATLERALRNAHAAGDANAARILASEITKMRAAPAPAASAQPWLDNPLPAQERPPAPEGGAYSGSILPLSRDAEGNVSFDSNAGILGSIKRSVMLPGEVMKGETQIYGPDGNVSPEMIGRSLEFASTMSPSTPGLRTGSGLIPGEGQQIRKSIPAAPSADDIYAAADDSYNAMRNSGVDYASSAVKQAAQTMKAKLEEQGFDPEVAGKTHNILNKLSSPPEDSVASIKGLHSARKTFGKIAQNYSDPTDQAAASQAIRGLDEFIGADDASSVVAGTASDAANALKAGNANYAAASRSDALTGIERAADLRASAANSGQNIGNTVRSRVASALLKPKEIAGYSPEEIAALEKIVTGTPAQNATRYVGNLLGGGGGLGQAMTGGVGAALGASTTGSGLGAAMGAAAPVAIGAVSKRVSNALTRRALEKADEMVRMRSPLYESMKKAAPMEVTRQSKTEALLRALLMGGATQQPQGMVEF